MDFDEEFDELMRAAVPPPAAAAPARAEPPFPSGVAEDEAFDTLLNGIAAKSTPTHDGKAAQFASPMKPSSQEKTTVAASATAGFDDDFDGLLNGFTKPGSVELSSTAPAQQQTSTWAKPSAKPEEPLSTTLPVTEAKDSAKAFDFDDFDFDDDIPQPAAGPPSGDASFEFDDTPGKSSATPDGLRRGTPKATTTEVPKSTQASTPQPAATLKPVNKATSQPAEVPRSAPSAAPQLEGKAKPDREPAEKAPSPPAKPSPSIPAQAAPQGDASFDDDFTFDDSPAAPPPAAAVPISTSMPAPAPAPAPKLAAAPSPSAAAEALKPVKSRAHDKENFEKQQKMEADRKEAERARRLSVREAVDTFEIIAQREREALQAMPELPSTEEIFEKNKNRPALPLLPPKKSESHSPEALLPPEGFVSQKPMAKIIPTPKFSPAPVEKSAAPPAEVQAAPAPEDEKAVDEDGNESSEDDFDANDFAVGSPAPAAPPKPNSELSMLPPAPDALDENGRRLYEEVVASAKRVAAAAERLEKQKPKATPATESFDQEQPPPAVQQFSSSWDDFPDATSSAETKSSTPTAPNQPRVATTLQPSDTPSKFDTFGQPRTQASAPKASEPAKGGGLLSAIDDAIAETEALQDRQKKAPKSAPEQPAAPAIDEFADEAISPELTAGRRPDEFDDEFDQVWEEYDKGVLKPATIPSEGLFKPKTLNELLPPELPPPLPSDDEAPVEEEEVDDPEPEPAPPAGFAGKILQIVSSAVPEAPTSSAQHSESGLAIDPKKMTLQQMRDAGLITDPRAPLGAIGEDDEEDGSPAKRSPQKVQAALQAEAEWASVNELRTQQLKENPSLLPAAKGLQEKASFLITYEEAFEFFSQVDMTEQRKTIQVEVPVEGLAGKLKGVKPKPKLPSSLLAERDLLFCIAKCPFDDAEPIHLRMLQTIYVKLTGDKLAPPRVGSHWELIGFQQSNPATDFRDMGMLSLLQLLFFVTKYTTPARTIHRLSSHDVRHFPFALVSINLTKIALQSLRSGRMLKAATRTGSVVSVFHHFFLGLYYEFFRIWGSEHRTIAKGDFGKTLQQLTSMALKHSRPVLQSFKAGVETVKPEMPEDSIKRGDKTLEELVQFSSLEDDE